ncbi:energy-coupling factor transport system permease protein [Paenibacillus sp. UNCCL117]|uniref:energy-coupling factor transporter transmembrane component T n=1 Tax=unclassified Paenibacillus TaxID=185978 RepID=UPI00089087B6|nr:MULTISPECIES: energy-coupling factor transporter transmembrane component T [unclassified Paenibacillus]SDE10764.1 energy-coupling factor transport system permease protein [Paenibacillus sp. cl123]SFW59841.1 energy-coupling factor transport system permease protein [Paenibacillus sp. UNCCL117]
MMRDAFSSFHPAVNFVYFTTVIVGSMIFMHPVLQAIALLSASAYALLLRGKRAARFNLLYMAPLLLLMAVVNPLFNHAGITILAYLPSGNPITLESLAYGLAAACMYVTVIIWFSCYNVVMTSDKFIYLFGRLWPALSLVFSMTLRFVPRYGEQIRIIANAQASIGRSAGQGGVLERARNGVRILSMMTTWALENAIETADSMKSRGYGLPGRTSFALFRFDRRDQAVSAVLFGLMLIVGAGACAGYNTMRFFPSIRLPELSLPSLAVYAAYGLLCPLPVLIQLLEEIKWRFTASGS